MKQLLILLCFNSICFSSLAQVQQTLEEQLQGKTRLQEIMGIVENYYAREKPANGSNEEKGKDCPTCIKDDREGYIHWKRWQYFNRSRVAEDGTIQNVFGRNYNAYKNGGFGTFRGVQSPNGIQAPSFNPSWVTLGPSDIVNGSSQSTGLGRANNMAFHPTDANTMWAATSSGGVFKTVNGGTTWFPLSEDISSLGIADIVVDYTNPNILYVLTGDGESQNGWNWFVQAYGYLRYSTGVLKSVDGGQTWQNTDLSFNQSDFNVGLRLAIHPSNPNILLAATNLGIYRTINGGNNWTLVLPAGTGANQGYYDIDFKPNNGNVVFATGRGANVQIKQSNDGGETWNTPSLGLPTNTRRITVSYVTGSPDSVYVICGNWGVSDFSQGLYRGKVDAFNNLSLSLVNSANNLVSAPQYTQSLSVRNGFVNIGGVSLMRSNNYGASFSAQGLNLHADIHGLQYNPLNNILYASSDGGVYSSTDNGFSFTFKSYGMVATQIYHMADYKPNAAKLLIGTQDNGTNYRNTANVVITNIGGCDGFSQAFHPTNSDTMLFICNETVFRSYDNGANNNSDINPPGHQSWYSLVGFNTINPLILYVGAEGGFYRRNTAGIWAFYSGVRGNSALHVCPNSNRLYIAGSQILNQLGGATFNRTDNDCTSFVNLINKPGMPVLASTTRYITSVFANPNNNSDVWITISGYQDGEKVYHSTDAGETWQNESDNLPNVPVNTVVVDGAGNVYVGNDFGVFARRAGDTQWFPFYNGLPNVPVTELLVNETVTKIRAATFGRGIWEADLLSTSCPASLNVTGTYAGQYNFSASNNITSNAVAVNTSGTKLTMNAGSNIVLNDGFRANAGTFVKLQIAPCGPVNIDIPATSNSGDKQITEQQKVQSALATMISLKEDSLQQKQKSKNADNNAAAKERLVAEIEADRKRQAEKEAKIKAGELNKSGNN